jgi:hypothetical protein
MSKDLALLDNITICVRVVVSNGRFDLHIIKTLDKIKDERASRMDNLERDRDG